ncbi:hypothetical protein ACFB49_22330 [Sphingomonas sp. DBB INV C78]|uniref:class I SAM-dependent methyltransferase n=1 Tax=Sphingomonas sp. DBB INV C78 TaxID=3349434 RepID=UPI0036D21569
MVNKLSANDEMSGLWNAHGGETWVELQALLDRLFLPFENFLGDAVRQSGASNVLDVGCGTGATTLAAARAVGSAGMATGLDISRPLIEAAQYRAQIANVANAHFLLADAQTAQLAPATFDSIISRFGIMFFDDPTAAFANLRQAAVSGASLTAFVWRRPSDNPFMVAAEVAAASFIPELEPVARNAPGQFGFSDPEYVQGILDSAWRDIRIEPIDALCELEEGDLDRYILKLGRVGKMLPHLSENRRAAVVDAVRRAFVPFVSGGLARFTAACWRIEAKAGQ